MHSVIGRNADKSKGGAARALAITNAYDPSQDRVAQRTREAWEKERDGLAISTGMLYDSLEAPEDARLSPERPQELGLTDEEKEAWTRAYIAAVIQAVRGDATWLNVERLVNSVLSTENPPSKSRRFWYNQIVAAEDAWLRPAAIKASVDPLAQIQRENFEVDQLRAGWVVGPDERCVMFFDGSKSDDATGLVGCRLSDGFVFTIGVWEKPPGERGKGWVVPRNEVNGRVAEAMERFNVVAFWGDPSHTKDDDETRFWDAIIDGWHREYKSRLEVWAVKTGDNAHSIMWDMTSPERSAAFTAAAERFVDEIDNPDPDEVPQPTFTHDGHPALMQHMRNAREFPNKWGTSLWKGHRESSKKIDLAVCAVGARMLRRVVLNRGQDEEKPVGGEVWGAL
jgi:hypothetical protein